MSSTIRFIDEVRRVVGSATFPVGGHTVRSDRFGWIGHMSVMSRRFVVTPAELEAIIALPSGAGVDAVYAALADVENHHIPTAAEVAILNHPDDPDYDPDLDDDGAGLSW